MPAKRKHREVSKDKPSGEKNPSGKDGKNALGEKKRPLVRVKVCPSCTWKAKIWTSTRAVEPMFDAITVCSTCGTLLELCLQPGRSTDQRPVLTVPGNVGASSSTEAKETEESRESEPVAEQPAKRQAVGQGAKPRREQSEVRNSRWCFRCKTASHDPDKCSGPPDETWHRTVKFDVGWKKYSNLRDADYDDPEVYKRDATNSKELMDTMLIFANQLSAYEQFARDRDHVLEALKNDSSLMKAIFGEEDPEGTGSVYEHTYTIANRATQRLMNSIVTSMYQLFKDQVCTSFPKSTPAELKMRSKLWHAEVSRRLNSTKASSQPLDIAAYKKCIVELRKAWKDYDAAMDDEEHQIKRFAKSQDIRIAHLCVLLLPTAYFRGYLDVEQQSNEEDTSFLPNLYFWPVENLEKYLSASADLGESDTEVRRVYDALPPGGQDEEIDLNLKEEIDLTLEEEITQDAGSEEGQVGVVKTSKQLQDLQVGSAQDASYDEDDEVLLESNTEAQNA